MALVRAQSALIEQTAEMTEAALIPFTADQPRSLRSPALVTPVPEEHDTDAAIPAAARAVVAVAAMLPPSVQAWWSCM